MNQGMATAIVLGLTVAARAIAEPADGPLPDVTPAQLAATLRAAMARYNGKGSFRVVFTSTQDTNWNNSEKPILVTFRGRARYESDGTRWRAEYEGMTLTSRSTRTRPDRWTTGFDGVQEYCWQVSENQFTVGEATPFAEQWGPRHIIWERTDQLVESLENPQANRTAIAIRQRVVDGVRCYVVESKTLDGKWGEETIISPKQGHLAISRKWTRDGKVYSSYTLQGVHEVAAGIWAPERIEDESLSVHDDGSSRLFSRRRIQIATYRPGVAPPASAFRVEVPYGVDFTDRRRGWSYHNDPWWPEVAAMLHDKYHWPPPDFSPLKDLQSPRETKLEGVAAPPLRVATWLNSSPVDLAALRGKVVLLEFWNIAGLFRRPIEPALNHLYAKYHPAGLEIVSIHPPTSDPDRLRRFLRDYGIPFPVAIDAAGPPPWGATADAYGTRDATHAFLVDREGKIHSLAPSIDKNGYNIGISSGGGNIVETIVALLKQAGARDVKAVSIELPRLPDQALNDANRLFPKLARAALEADPRGTIPGRIVDASLQPIAGATVQATLQFTMLMSMHPGANFVIVYRAGDERFRASTGKDGRFELSGLCKGTYAVKVEAPGRAWKERKAYLAADGGSAALEFVMDQGGAIAGRVLDSRGKPISKATVLATERQQYENGALRYTTSLNGIGAKTDAEGRFRLGGLQEGRYVFQVMAPGFKDQELAPIAAGNENVAVTLERSP